MSDVSSSIKTHPQRTDDTIWAIISALPPGRIQATDATWHHAFAALKVEFGSRLPGLQHLEFHRSDAVAPISDELDEILQLMDASILAPSLNVIELDANHRLNHSRHLDLSQFDTEAIEAAAQKLQEYLSLPAVGF